MTEQECKKKLLDTLEQFEKDNNVHITSVSIPTRCVVGVQGADYVILEPRIEYEPVLK